MWASKVWSVNAMRAGFHAIAAPSGVNATPASPKAPLRLSGAIMRKGTAVVMVFNCNCSAVSTCVSCAVAFRGQKKRAAKSATHGKVEILNSMVRGAKVLRRLDKKGSV